MKLNFSSFVLVYVLINPIFNCILYLLNIQSGSGQLQYAYITMFVLTLLYVLRNIRNGCISNSSHIWFALSIFFLAFITTSFLYEGKNAMYISELLCWGASSLPATVCGIMFCNIGNWEQPRKLVPLFVAPLTILISYISFTTTGRNSGDLILDDSTGLNYQSISYYMAQFFGLSVYYLTCSGKKQRLIEIVLYLLMMLQFITCFSSGGRGGLVLLILFLLYWLFMQSQAGKSFVKSSLSIGLIVLLFYLVFRNSGLSRSAGYERILSTFESGDSNRDVLQSMALLAFSDSPIFGKGIGSIFYLIGTYSHNIFTDLLAESGLLGFLIFTILLIKSIRKIVIHPYDKKDYFVSILLIYAITLNMFSGYWPANHVLWFVLGYVFTKKYNHNV